MAQEPEGPDETTPIHGDSPIDCGSDLVRFTALAQAGGKARMIDDEDGTVFSLEIVDGPVFVKRCERMADNESEALRKLFLGKELRIPYQPGTFNTGWITTMTTELHLAEGELKYAIHELMLGQYEQSLEDLRRRD